MYMEWRAAAIMSRYSVRLRACAAAVHRHGARDADRDIAQRIVHGCGHAVPAGCGPTRRNMLLRPRRIERLVRGLAPAVAQQVAERAPPDLDGHHHVVERRVRCAGHHAVLVLRRVLARVPAARGQVDAAAEGDRVVDDHDLLDDASRRRDACCRSGSRSGGAASTTGHTAAPTRGRARRSSGNPRSGC